MAFIGFKIDPLTHLLTHKRSLCPNCGKSEHLYCPACSIPLGHSPPKVSLPVKVDLYRHPHENEGKTTTTHAKVISPQDVEIIVSSTIKSYQNPRRILLLFPSKSSLPISQIDPTSFDKLVVIDGTWKQARAMAHSVKDIPFQHVKIESHETLFWRFQKYDRTYLATIEAIYWFFVEYSLANDSSMNYDGKYDNLLFYFKLNYDRIQQHYRENNKHFTNRHALGDSYIER